MNSQNDNERIQGAGFEDGSDNTVNIGERDIVKIEGERTPVDVFEKTIHDDIDDYLFLKRHKKKHQSHHSTDKPDYSGDESVMIVASTKTSRGQKKRKKKKVYTSDKSHKHRYKHSKEQKSTKILKKVLLCAGCVLLALILLFVGTAAYLLFKGGSEIKADNYVLTAPDGVSVQDNGQNVYYNGNTYVLNENITGILCMGIDKENIEGEAKEGTGTNGQADLLILIAMDTETGKMTLINISRDTMTDVAIFTALGTFVETKNQQICLSYAYGADEEQGAENTVTSVERLFFNFPIKSYFALDLEGIAALTDSVGGVDVVSPETIPGFEEGQSYHLIGKQAESFVRYRDISKVDSNVNRMERQQTFLDSFISTALTQTKQDITFPLSVFNDAKDYCSTNINPAKITYLAQSLVRSDGMAIEKASVPGEVKMGETYAEFHVDETKFYEMFLDIFYNKI